MDAALSESMPATAAVVPTRSAIRMGQSHRFHPNAEDARPSLQAEPLDNRAARRHCYSRMRIRVSSTIHRRPRSAASSTRCGASAVTTSTTCALSCLVSRKTMRPA